MRISRLLALFALFSLAGGGSLAAPVERLVASAISLKAPVRSALDAYAATRPEIKLTYSFAASGVLLRQLEAGAPIALVLFADKTTMDDAVAKELVETGSVAEVATNRVVLAVASAKATGKLSPGILGEPALSRIAVGNPAYVPLGAYVKKALLGTGEWEKLKDRLILTSSAEQTFAYVASGEVDAAFIYATDAKRLEAGHFKIIEAEAIEPARYFAAVVAGAGSDPVVAELRDYLLSPEGRASFAASGFGPPSEAAR